MTYKMNQARMWCQINSTHQYADDLFAH